MSILAANHDAFGKPVELYGADGKLIGLFVPVIPEPSAAAVASKVDWAEIARRKQAGGKGATHEEIWERIERLESELGRRKAAGERELSTEEAMAYYRSLWDESEIKTSTRNRAP